MPSGRGNSVRPPSGRGAATWRWRCAGRRRGAAGWWCPTARARSRARTSGCRRRSRESDPISRMFCAPRTSEVGRSFSYRASSAAASVSARDVPVELLVPPASRRPRRAGPRRRRSPSTEPAPGRRRTRPRVATGGRACRAPRLVSRASAARACLRCRSRGVHHLMATSGPHGRVRPCDHVPGRGDGPGPGRPRAAATARGRRRPGDGRPDGGPCGPRLSGSPRSRSPARSRPAWPATSSSSRSRWRHSTTDPPGGERRVQSPRSGPSQVSYGEPDSSARAGARQAQPRGVRARPLHDLARP